MNKLLLTAAVLALASVAQAQEETAMTMEEVPAEIMDAANAANTQAAPSSPSPWTATSTSSPAP